MAYRPERKSYALGVYQPEPGPTGLMYLMSRPLLEHCLRRRVRDLPNVETRDRSLVRDVLMDEGPVTGVVIEGANEWLPTWWSTLRQERSNGAVDGGARVRDASRIGPFGDYP